MKGFLSQSAKHWISLIVAVLIFLGILIMIDIISVRSNAILDLSPTKIHTLSPQTKKILGSLKEDVELTVFYEKGNRSKFAYFLELCSRESKRFKYRLLDFDRYPGEAKRYGIIMYDSAVIECNNKRKVIQYPGEELLVNGILKITRDVEKVILFLSGHGEHDFNEDKNGYSSVKRALEQENYHVEGFSLIKEKEIPAGALLIVGGPQEDLSEQEIRGISNFIYNGGRAIFMIDPYTAPALVGLIKKNYGIILGDDTVVDMKYHLVGEEGFVPIVPLFSKAHPITRDFTSAIVLPSARSIQLKEPPEEGVSAQPLAMTSGESWGELNKKSLEKGNPEFEEGKDTIGPIPAMVIASVKGKKEAKIVVFGDSDFVNNSYLNVLGNKDFFLNTVSFLAEEKDLISIRPKAISKSADNRLVLTKKQSGLIFWLAVIIEPALVLLIGVVIFLRRRIKG